MAPPPNGSNIVATFTDGTEAPLYYFDGEYWYGVPDDPEDLSIEPTAIVAWRIYDGD